ncbi:MAG: aminopeptidase P family protein [Chloroflexota bacterium]|nr:MAG: aminopeptidase P family protein [Chloroflexota bacterium]
MQADYQKRQSALNAVLDAKELDAIAIVPGANLIYFTGLHAHLSERPIIALFNREGLSIIMPQLEMPKVAERPDLEARVFPWNDVDGYEGAFAEAVEALGLRGGRLGVDGMTMRVTEMLAFQRVDSSIRVEPVERDLIRIRARKQPDEIEAMRRAIKISEQALAQLLEWVRPGMTEREIAARLSTEQLELGGEGESFGTMVQTGPNSANPHGAVSNRALQENEFLLIDFGCLVDGYPSDITRTFCLGEPSAEMQRIFDTVVRANEAARAAVKPGVPMGEIDRAARDVIDAAGYGEYFIHRTGHGLGLDVHEPIPQIAAGVSDPLEPGMTFTIEPGIYIPGLGGVRVEDNVVVTENGVDVLTSFPRELVIKR